MLSGVVGDRTVAAAWLSGRTTDNTNKLRVSIDVRPDERGRGYGTAVLAEVEGRARALGRSLLDAETCWFEEEGSRGERSRDAGWLVSHGFVLGLVDVQRRLPLPVPARTLDDLAAEAAQHHEGYVLRSWQGPVPEELLAGWAEVVAAVETEAPTGDLEIEPEVPDPASVRENERLLVAQGRTKFNTVALAPDGSVAAYTDLALTVHESDRGYQWGTLVRREHRGRRLGLAVKVANLALLQREAPQVRSVRTFNADVNAQMIEVNQRLGFEVEQRLGIFQKTLG